MSYLWPAGLTQNYCDNIEAKGTVLYIVTCEEIACCFQQSGFFWRCDRCLGFGEILIRPGFDLDKDDTAVGIDHYQVYLASFAVKIPRESFEAFAF